VFLPAQVRYNWDRFHDIAFPKVHPNGIEVPLPILVYPSFNPYFFYNNVDPHESAQLRRFVQRIGLQAIQATLGLFTAATKTFLPTPTQSHYLFNLRDFSRVTLGCLQTPPSLLDSPEKFIRLWMHESNRVFADRLVDSEDQKSFFEIIKAATNNTFKVPLEKILSHLSDNSASLEPNHVRSLFFGDFASDSKVFNEISDNAQNNSRRILRRIQPDVDSTDFACYV
jgi:hypothetical protein